MHRLTLIRHASTAAVRGSAFPLDEPLDERGRAAAAALRGVVVGDRSGLTATAPPPSRGLSARAECWCAPSQRAIETAALLGLAEPVIDPALDECDFGSWRGRSLAEVHEESPGDVGAWMTDPAAAPHGGESLAALAGRVAGWLEARAAIDGGTVAVTSGGVIRAAVVHALGAHLLATWRVDVSPLHATVLHAHDGRWTVRSVNVPLGVGAGVEPARVGAGARASVAGDGAPDVGGAA